MKSIITLVLVVTLGVATAAAFAQKKVGSKDFSGWMKNYDQLVYQEKRNAFVFFNEEKRGQYEKVLVQSITLYSKSGTSDAKVATESTEYMEQGMRELLERKNLLATEPGPGVAYYNVAITGVEKTKESLKAYNIIPVSAVFRGAQAVSGKVPTYIDAMFEGELTDSVTGERVAAIVVKAIEETEKRSGDELGFEDVKPTLDKWLAQYDRTLDEFLILKASRGEALSPVED